MRISFLAILLNAHPSQYKMRGKTGARCLVPTALSTKSHEDYFGQRSD
jgi:hypothetical protein